MISLIYSLLTEAESMPAIYWIASALAFVIIEMAWTYITGDTLFVMAPIALASAATGLIAIFINDIVIETIVFCALSIFFFAKFRPLIMKYARVEPVMMNVHALVGQKGIVLQEIANYEDGRVKIGGETWKASIGDDKTLKKGDEIIVMEVSGATVIVCSVED